MRFKQLYLKIFDSEDFLEFLMQRERGGRLERETASRLGIEEKVSANPAKRRKPVHLYLVNSSFFSQQGLCRLAGFFHQNAHFGVRWF